MMQARHERFIELADTPRAERPEKTAWRSYTAADGSLVRIVRRGDTRHTFRSKTFKISGPARSPRTDRTITHTKESAIVYYNDILRSARFEPDHVPPEPWKAYEEYEHALVTTVEFEAALRVRYAAILDEGRIRRIVQQYCQGCTPGLATTHTRITFPFDGYAARELQALFDFHRECGASKQVAAQLVAKFKRQLRDDIERWRTTGWTWSIVVCGHAGYRSALSGIADQDLKDTDELIRTVVDEVVHQLEADLYLVRGKPYRRWHARKLKQQRQRLRDNRNSQNAGLR